MRGWALRNGRRVAKPLKGGEAMSVNLTIHWRGYKFTFRVALEKDNRHPDR